MDFVKEDSTAGLTWFSDQNLRESRGVPGESIPRSIWVAQPLLYQAVVRPGIAAFSPVQRQHIKTGWQPLRLHTPSQSLLVCVGAVFEGPGAFDPQQELVGVWPLCASHVPHHGVLGVLAGLGGDGAIDPDTAVFQIYLRLVVLLHFQLTLCKELKGEGGGGFRRKRERADSHFYGYRKMWALVTGTQCNFCFVTEDMLLGLFLVATGQEKIVTRGWVQQLMKRERKKGTERRRKCQANQSCGDGRSAGIKVKMYDKMQSRRGDKGEC